MGFEPIAEMRGERAAEVLWCDSIRENGCVRFRRLVSGGMEEAGMKGG